MTKDGKTQQRTLSKGQYLFPGSSWHIDDIKKTQDGFDITLKDSKEQNALLRWLFQKQATVSVNQTSQKLPGESQQYEDWKARIKSIEDKLNSDCSISNVRDKFNMCQSDITQPLEALLNEPLPISLQERVTTSLARLRDTYFSLITTLQRKIDQEKNTAEKEKLKTEQETIKQAQKEIGDKLSNIQTRKSSSSASTQQVTFNEAVSQAEQAYSRVSQEYKDSPYALHALYRLGIVQWTMEKNFPAALETFEKIISTYDDQQIANLMSTEGVSKNDITGYISLLTAAKDNRIFTDVIKDLEEPDGSITTVTILNVEDIQPDQEATAKIKIGTTGHEESFSVNQHLNLGGGLDWYIVSIKDKSIDIGYMRANNPVTRTITTGKSELIPTEPGNNPPKESIVPIQLVSTNLQREVHVTIEPASERAFSEAHYTLHLPIEKRPFDLPLFSETIDDEIAKTEKLLAKLDKIIQQSTAIHNVWTKACYITYLTLWTKNLLLNPLFGGQSSVVRKKVNEIYKERYDQGRLDCGELSFEQCIMEKHLDDYDHDLDTVSDALDDISNKKYKSFSRLGKEYNDDQKTAYIYQRLRQEHPDDKEISASYLASLKNLQLRAIEADTANAFYDGKKLKDYSGVKSIADQIITSTPELKKEVDGGRSFEDVYKEHKDTIFRNYKDEQISKGMEGFFGDLIANKKTPNGILIHTEEINIAKALNDTFFRTPNPRLELPKDMIRKEGDRYYFPLNGITIIPGTEDEIKEKLKKDSFDIEIGDTKYTFTSSPHEEPHKKMVALGGSGPGKGRVEFLTIDALHYVEVAYSASGKIESTKVYKRVEPNTPPGGKSDIRVGDYNDVVQQQQKINPLLYNKLSAASSCISLVNKRVASSSYKVGDRDVAQCTNLGSYTVSPSAKSAGPSCIDFMSPSECKIMFNACDPVICPASRCNFGGEWHLDNVVQSGIVGSTFACMDNFPEVYMPICITGIVAGLQNIRSVIAGYDECLKAAKVEGRSIGICDKIRSLGICDILWREAIAVFNVRQGVVGKIGKAIFGEPEGGGEYSSFQQSFDNSVNNLKYFTQDYAKNVFAQYNGGSLPEIGGAICKSAIYGKVPGIGNFFNQITRPESPPQFTAFFDEAPFTDITNQPMSIYNIFYHLYAGANQDVRYSVYLQSKDLNGQQVVPPLFVIRSRPLPRGQFASESISIQRPSGYQEICIELNTLVYGRQVQCGFGKVSTSYMLNKINDEFIQSEIRKGINSEEACTPEPGRVTTLGFQGSQLTGGPVSYPTESFPLSKEIGLGVGSVSTGFLSTGIVRKCSQFDPGIGKTPSDWVPVGSCGKDERGRDSGTCWLYQPAAVNLIKTLPEQKDIKGDLENRARKIAEQAEEQGKDLGIKIMSEEEVSKKNGEAQDLRNKGTVQDTKKAIDLYTETLNSLYLGGGLAVKILYNLGKAYEELANLLQGGAAVAKLPQQAQQEQKTDTSAQSQQSTEGKPDNCVIKGSFYKDQSRTNKIEGSIRKGDVPEIIYVSVDKAGTTSGCTDANNLEFFYSGLESADHRLYSIRSKDNKIGPNFVSRSFAISGAALRTGSSTGNLQVNLVDVTNQHAYGYAIGGFAVQP